jgi:hypothetical protein
MLLINLASFCQNNKKVVSTEMQVRAQPRQCQQRRQSDGLMLLTNLASFCQNHKRLYEMQVRAHPATTAERCLDVINEFGFVLPNQRKRRIN